MFNGMKFDTFTLNNDLQVLAISDDRFVKSSAALAVMAGSMQNPDEHLGLAHFLEHMLFLGTNEYPEVGEYEDFLNKNGGGHNAYTSIDHTNYFFDITHANFEGALKRFSRFFVSPTFDEKYVEREKNAVHSEHEKNLKEDGRREYRFLQMITDPNHPFSKFATGDKETLKDANRDVVMDFYSQNYSSNLMRLVLMSPLSTEELRSLAATHFEDIPNKKLKTPEYSDSLFLDKEVPKFHHVQSVRDLDILKLSFDMPDDLPYWESKPTQFLAHLIGEEGEGSLLSYLKEKGWALGLETSTWWRMFHIKVQLTDLGKVEYEEVIRSCFSYINLLKKEGLKDFIFEERKKLADTELQFIEPRSSMGRASQYSASMLYFPVESFLSHYYLYHKYSPEDFEKFLSYLRVDNMQVSLFTKEEIKDSMEPFYGIGFRSKDFSPQYIEELKNLKVFDELKYPEPNPYVPSDLDLIKEPVIEPPKMETHKNYTTIFSQVDTDLKIPKGSISLSFVSDKIKGDPKNYLMAKLFVKLKKEELNEWGYPSRLAGFHYNISHGYNTITIDVNGFSQHLVKLLSHLVEDPQHNRRINHVVVNPKTFESIKVKIRRSLENREFDAAYQQLLSENSNFFSTSSVHYKDYLPFLDDITIEEINAFAKEFFSCVAVRAFTYGNLEGEELKPLVDGFFKQFKSQGLTEKDVEAFENRYPELPKGRHLLQFSGSNNNNAQLSFYKGTEWNFENQAYYDVLSKIIEQPYFTELRTHQQLGYVVAAFGTSSHGFCGIGCLIQSQTHSADDIFTRSEVFLKNFLKEAALNIQDQDVEMIKESLLSEIRQIPNSMGERLSRFTLMAGTYHGDFNFFDKLAARVDKVSSEGLKNFMKKHVDLESSDVTSLVLLFNGLNKLEHKVPENLTVIDDAKSFLEHLPKIQPYKRSSEMS